MHSGQHERRPWTHVVAIIVVASVTSGCPHDRKTEKPKVKRRAKVESFSEASAVRLLTSARPYVFSAAARGLERWDLESGQSLTLDAEHGLAGDRVEAMTFDASRGWLWAATDGGMTRYEVKSETFSELPAPPSILGLKSFAGATLSAAADGGLWIAHRKGLFYTNTSGQWTETGITEQVNAVLHASNGWLWIGAKSGLMGRRPDGETFRLGRESGCDIAKVRFIAEAPGDSPVVVGENEKGEQRIILILNNACATYRAAPEETWLAAGRRAEELVVLTSGGLYAMHITNPGARSLMRNGMRLLPVTVKDDSPPPKSPYVFQSLDVAVPGNPRALAVLDDNIFIGTDFLGIARLRVKDGKAKRTWLRRGDLVQGAYSLTVACAKEKSCFVATGGRYAWHYDGESFTKVVIEGVHIVGFVRAPNGKIYAFTRNQNEDKLIAYTYKAKKWTLVEGLEIETRGRMPFLRCARFSPAGLLWMGLEYEDDAGEPRAYGTAVIELSLNSVAYHRASAEDSDVMGGVMPIPIGIIDLAFVDDEEVWLASTEGAARVHVSKQEVRVFSEADGLESEFLRGIAVNPGGIVFAASGRGVNIYDGERWTFPKSLKLPVNDVDMGKDGRVWLATDRGVVIYDGAQTRRIDRRRGLIEDQIDEIRTDRFGRVWTRSSEGISIISP